VMREICEDNVKDGVRYLEVRFAPILHLQKGMSLDDVMESVCGEIPTIEKAMPITVKIIVCAMRQMDTSTANEAARLAVKYKSKGVVALDLAGPELGYPCEKFKEAFTLAKEGGLNVTIDAGEADGANSIRNAIELCSATRIGHGTALIKDATLLKEVREKKNSVGILFGEQCENESVKKHRRTSSESSF